MQQVSPELHHCGDEECRVNYLTVRRVFPDHLITLEVLPPAEAPWSQRSRRCAYPSAGVSPCPTELRACPRALRTQEASVRRA